tara:strand:- start:19136 stop:19981 length:846 start_codon:yes stop_codon:yes gene_type:complete
MAKKILDNGVIVSANEYDSAFLKFENLSPEARERFFLYVEAEKASDDRRNELMSKDGIDAELDFKNMIRSPEDIERITRALDTEAWDRTIVRKTDLASIAGEVKEYRASDFEGLKDRLDGFHWELQKLGIPSFEKKGIMEWCSEEDWLGEMFFDVNEAHTYKADLKVQYSSPLDQLYNLLLPLATTRITVSFCSDDKESFEKSYEYVMRSFFGNGPSRFVVKPSLSNTYLKKFYHEAWNEFSEENPLTGDQAFLQVLARVPKIFTQAYDESLRKQRSLTFL